MLVRLAPPTGKLNLLFDLVASTSPPPPVLLLLLTFG